MLKTFGLLSAIVILTALSGCSTIVNPANSADFACPGMPLGVTCKTPAAVYKSTNQDLPVTEFDTPIGAMSVLPKEAAAPSPVTTLPAVFTSTAESGKTARPKPVREPAQVMRIWIAPWVDNQDTLHLAQLHYAEIVPRTWTVGKPETRAGGGYVIPHLAFDNIGQTSNSTSTNPRPEQRESGSMISSQPATNAHLPQPASSEVK